MRGNEQAKQSLFYGSTIPDMVADATTGVRKAGACASDSECSRGEIYGELKKVEATLTALQKQLTTGGSEGYL